MTKPSKLLRIRFTVNADDPRPIHWPIKHPYWVSGYTGDGERAWLVSYADNEQYILDNWPEAIIDSVQEEPEYIFTDRFQKPDWFKQPLTAHEDVVK